MEQMRKLELQRKAAEGREAADLLTGKFGDAWLDLQKRRALAALSGAKTPADLAKAQAEYRAAISFRSHLASKEREGKRAAEAIKKAMTEGTENAI